MIYLYHDFYSNFSSGVSAEGNNLTIDLFANELSDMIVYKTEKLVDTLSKVGIDVNLNMSDEEIVDKTIDGISKDEKVVKAIGFAIAEGNGLINKEKGNQVDWVKAVNAVVLGLTPAAKEITKSEESKISTKNKIMQQIQTKAKSKGNYTRTIWKPAPSSGSNALWLVAGVVVVGVCAYLIYRGTRTTSTVAQPAVNPLPNG